VSRQAFGILPKIREVDRCMTPALQTRVYEAHPELAFRTLTGAPIADNKKTRMGHQARLHALAGLQEPPFGDLAHTFTQTCTTFKRTHVAPDDLLDAYVLAWTARRIATGQAERLPPSPPVDRRELRMEIWY
jgi:predicted RNase H-like nuclease